MKLIDQKYLAYLKGGWAASVSVGSHGVAGAASSTANHASSHVGPTGAGAHAGAAPSSSPSGSKN